MESKNPVENPHGYYLLCFFRGTPVPSFPRGIHDGFLPFALSFQDMHALVCRVPSHEYQKQSNTQGMADLEWLAPKARRHEEIIRKVAEQFPVIPVKFGAIFLTREKVLEIVRRGYEEFAGFLDSVRDKVEWGVKVFVDEEEYLNKTVGEEQVLANEGRGSSLSTGAAFLFKKRQENRLRKQLPTEFDGLSDHIFRCLGSSRSEGRRNRILSKNATGKKQEMILNSAFLITKPKESEFLDQIQEFGDSLRSKGVLFEVCGPWPPYNFCPMFRAFEDFNY